MKHWLILYDVRDPRRLSKIAKMMENYAERVQYSVFEAICEREQIEDLRSEIKRIMDPEDFVVYFELCGHDWQKQIKYGPLKYEILEEKEYYLL